MRRRLMGTVRVRFFDGSGTAMLGHLVSNYFPASMDRAPLGAPNLFQRLWTRLIGRTR